MLKICILKCHLSHLLVRRGSIHHNFSGILSVGARLRLIIKKRFENILFEICFRPGKVVTVILCLLATESSALSRLAFRDFYLIQSQPNPIQSTYRFQNHSMVIWNRPMMKVNESGWKRMKVGENGWKWTKMVESGWKRMNVDENIHDATCVCDAVFFILTVKK